MAERIQISGKPIIWLKKGVWLYFYLLLFEGALRKWILPELSDFLLVIRDPLAIALIFYSWKLGYFKLNRYAVGMASIAVVGIGAALLVGHQNIPVTIYGARILLVQFPLIFLIGQVFNKKDVFKIGKHFLWLSIPMTVLIAMQFYSPQSSWVNRGVGGDLEGAGFSGAMGFFRPPGTFSFTNGNTFFYSLLAIFILIFLLNRRENRVLLFLSSISLVIAIPLSISRTLLFSVLISFFFYLVSLSFRPNFFKRFLVFVFSAIILGFVVSNLEFFNIAVEAFTSRFESASESEGGLEGTLVDRYLGGFVNAVFDSKNIPFFGHGIGMGTNVGSQLLSGDREFLIAEEEWARTIGEMGFLLGLGIILIRLLFTWKLALLSFTELKKNSCTPWMLLSFVLLIFPQGQWAQPTALGFAVFSSGLLLSSLDES